MKKMSVPLFVSSMLLLLAFAVISVVLPDRSVSDMENRPLTVLQQPQLTTILNGNWMKQAEVYTSDQFPFRDFFVQLNILKERMLLQTEHKEVILGKEGHLFERGDRLPARPAAQSNINAIESLMRKTGLPVDLVIIPSSTQIYWNMLPAFYPLADAGVDQILEQAKKHSISTILVQETLQTASLSDTAYYYTDHHLTWHGAKAVVQEILSKWGLEYIEPDEVIKKEGFLGSFYSRAPFPFVKADCLSYAHFDNLQLVIDGKAKTSLVDEKMLQGRNKYAALLHNNPGHLTILNNDIYKRVLFVIRDSNANIILPSLAQYFSRVEAVDLRFYSGNLLECIEESEADQILCIFGTDIFLTDRNLPLQLTGI